MIDEQRLLATLREFIAAPSPQIEPDKLRAFIADVVRPRLPVDFFDAVRLDAAGNLLALKHAPDTSNPLLVLTYGGTFPAEGMGDEAFIPKDVDGTPYGIPGPAVQGRGVTEQIAPLAAAVEAVQALADDGSKLRRSLLFATITSGETGSHEVVDAMAARGDLDVGGVVLVAGTGNAICLGNLGRVDIEVEVRGLACHSSDPSRGLNAIEGLARFLERLRLVQLREDPEIGRAALTPVNVETWPKAIHTVPDRARLILDRRLVPGETVEQAMQEIRDALVDFDPFTLEVHARKFQLPSKVAPDEGPAQIVRTALEAVTGTSRIVYWRAALDAGFFTARGIQTVVFGPGDLRLAHTDYELVSVSEVIQATEVYRRVLLESCGAQ